MKGTIAIKSMAIAGALAMSIALVGCGGQQKPAETKTEEKTTQTQQQTTQKTEDTSKTSEQSTSQNTSNQNSSSSQTQAPAQTQTQAPASAAQQISADDAKSIALADAGVTAADVRDLKAELDTDDATVHYDVDFKVGNTEHDYDIDVHTGKIISHKTEIDND
jgi:uncharacterized membrane protein YkoI